MFKRELTKQQTIITQLMKKINKLEEEKKSGEWNN